MNIVELQKTLNRSKKLCKKFDDNLELIKLETLYQKYINKFSPAYLSGSPWYIGPSLIQWINNKKINTDLLTILFYISNNN